MVRKVDRKNNFISVFNAKTGFYARGSVMD